MNLLVEKSKQKEGKSGSQKRRLLFPAAVAAVYVVLYIAMPDKTILALRSSCSIVSNIVLPLILVFVVMILMNLFLNPAQTARLIGKKSGIRGKLLPAVAGVISAGPIYAWYPLLRDIKSKGSGNSPLAIFLYNRSIKPYLLPAMVGYFGMVYVIILTVCMLLGSFVVGYAIDYLTDDG